MLKPLVKRGLFFSIGKGFLPHKMGTLDFGGNFTPRNQLTTKARFGCKERPANRYRVSWRSVQETKKAEKARLGWTFHPTPKRPPFLYTFRFVHVGWGHRHNHPCQVSSQSVQQFRLPRGSKFTISHRLGKWLLQQLRTNVLHCDEVDFLFTCTRLLWPFGDVNPTDPLQSKLHFDWTNLLTGSLCLYCDVQFTILLEY